MILLYLASLFKVKKISLVQFKNYESRAFLFDERIVGISGKNGVGKTNLLDAIYYLCFTKSYFSRSDLQNIKNGTSGFRAEANLALQGKSMDAICVVREGEKKEFMVNGEPYERFSEHVGKFPCVIVAPDDVDIIAGGSEVRRRFMDALISQIDSVYLRTLIEYNKVLQQRNSYLKSIAEDKSTDLSLLDVYDDQMVKAGYILFEKRKFYLGQALPSASSFYQQISNDQASMELVYESQLLNGSFMQLLRSQRERDIYLQRTLAGIHRDNIEIRLDGEPFRYMASQGQRKSLLFALKLAEFMLLKEAKGFSPILLLDDVFEKLDADRMHNLLHWVCVENDGQIFITDTHGERIRQKLEELGLPFQLIEL